MADELSQRHYPAVGCPAAPGKPVAVVQLPVEDGAVMMRLFAVTVPFDDDVPTARTHSPVASDEFVSFSVVVFEIDVDDEIVMVF